MINTPLTATEPNGARTSAVASADAPYPAYLTCSLVGQNCTQRSTVWDRPAHN